MLENLPSKDRLRISGVEKLTGLSESFIDDKACGNECLAILSACFFLLRLVAKMAMCSI